MEVGIYSVKDAVCTTLAGIVRKSLAHCCGSLKAGDKDDTMG